MSRRIIAMFSLVVAATVTASYAFDPDEGSPAANSPAPGTIFLYPERIPLENGEFVTADRGMIFVPVNRNNPRSGVTGVEIYRFRASDEGARERSPVFLLNGGPGFSGMEQPLRQKGFYERRVMPLTEIADVVVVGQRGIGSSKPNTMCEPGDDAPLDRDVSDDEAVAAVRATSAKCKSFWESEEIDLSGFTVVEAAADVAAVRDALGYDEIMIGGGSFGSHWGMAVMRFHPEIVSHALLNGMEGPDHTYDMPSSVLNSVTRMARVAEQSDQLRGLIPEGGLVEALRTVIARVEAEPVEVMVRNPQTRQEEIVRFDADDVRGMALGYTLRMSSRNGMRTWPSDILRLYSGDFSRAAEVRMRNRLGDDGYRTASYFVLDCGSGISREREAQLNADTANAIVGKLGWWY